ncbi:MAG TPA: AIR synthase-related protein, partial [Myxococcota bacterium]|nr:AIR synthase-related protein [Myxococcota bacterium]
NELLRVFNCGIGMIAIVPEALEDDILQRLQGLGERGYRIGFVERKAPGDPPLVFDPGFLSSE